MNSLDPLKTLHLTERQTTSCRLHPADLEYLWNVHKTHLAIRPTGKPHRYQITPRGYVGTITTPHYRLQLRPKMPVRNFFHLVDSETPVSLPEEGGTTKPGSVLLETLVLYLVQKMDERARNGLLRGYVEKAEQSPFLQGRLDVAAQMSQVRKDQLACRFEDYTSDVPLNQIPKSTAELVLRQLLLSEFTRQRLLRSLRAFQDISSLPLSPRLFEEIRLDRLSQDYEPLLNLCRLFVDSLTSPVLIGTGNGPTFLLNLEQIFERYCTRHLMEHFQKQDDLSSRYQILPQSTFLPHEPLADQPELPMRPDLTICRQGNPHLVIDVKWKRFPLVRSDLYQVMAYCAALSCPRGMLLYPGTRNRSWRYSFAENSLQISIQQVRVTGSETTCREAMGNFLKSCRAFLEEDRE